MAYGGFTGKILRVNLSDGSMKNLDTFDYVPDFIGGVALAYRLVWDEIIETTTEWSPENPLIFTTGPCAATPIPSAGRANVVGLSPQSYPIPYLCTSGFGGEFGPKMKLAGYDAIVITGKSPSPVYLYVSTDGVEIMDGAQIWGTGNYNAQDWLANKHGQDVAIAAIGQAGENRVRWAAIESRTENGAGQGGFGALMGDKKLKAVVVKPGNTRIPVANPEKMIEVINRLNKEMSPTGQDKVALIRDRGSYTTRRQSCPWSSCTGGIAGCLPTMYNRVPLENGIGTVSGVEYCCPGVPTNIMESMPSEVRSELRRLEGQLGLNHWETQLGMNFWMLNEYRRGRLNRILGEAVPGDGTNMKLTPDFVKKFDLAVAFRQGEGDIWAEGTTRAANAFGMEDEVWKTHKHGYGPHWDGRYLQFVRSPVWVVSALTWATHGRDAFNHQHGYPERYPPFVKEWATREGATSGWGTPQIPYAQICELGAQIYGAEHANSGWDDSSYQYTDKEYVGLWHECRGMIKDSVPMCDRQFPLLYDSTTTPATVGWTDAETQAYNAIVGTEWTLDDMHKACMRAQSLLRSIWTIQGRTRANDESVIPYFTQPDAWPNDAGPSVIDPGEFRALLSRYYALHGWSDQGIPTKATLDQYGLGYVANELQRLGKI